MNIKSLLLGSAAALAVVSGAQAADAVVAAEPEPMEYVRVCDAYGTGYFYIPGTETCLKIGGQFRYQKEWSDTNARGVNSTYSNWSRGRVEFTAKNDSEWGTVSSWLRLQGSHRDNRGSYAGDRHSVVLNPDGTTSDVYSPVYNNANMEAYYTFGIGGLEFAYYDSQWAQILGYGGRTDWGADYLTGPAYSRQYISYKASFDAVTAVLSIEHDRNANYDPALTTDGRDRKWMPDVVAGVTATMGDYGVTGVAAYDESDESFAIAKKITGDMGMFGLTLVGLYSNSHTNSYFSYDGFSVILGASASVTDTVSLAADFQYWDNNDYRVIGDINWAVATGFSVLLEGSYGSFNQPAARDLKVSTAMLRFQRSF